MNRELRALLREAGWQGAESPEGWSRVVVMSNYAAAPPPPGMAAGHARKGFRLLCLDGWGRTVRTARCAAAADARLELEGRILETLAAMPELSRHVPATRSACSATLRVQLSDFVPGRPYHEFVAEQDPSTWARCSTDILMVAERVGRAAQGAIPELARGGDRIVLAESIASELRLLAASGVAPAMVEALERVVSVARPIASATQHGDLWPGNVVRYRDSWWLLDFAEFGRARVPMYDVFHMVRYNPGRGDPRHGHIRLAIGVTAAADAWTTASRRVVADAAGRFGLVTAEVAATLIYYLVHLACYRLRPGVPAKYREPYLEEVRAAAEIVLGHGPEGLLGEPV